MNTTTKLVWNGCDGYVIADYAAMRDYNFDGQRLYKGSQSWAAFEAVEINAADLPKDDDGEPDLDGIFGTDDGRHFKAI